jgi:hypothetical protein
MDRRLKDSYYNAKLIFSFVKSVIFVKIPLLKEEKARKGLN